MEVIWRFHWDALGCHSWAPNKLHCRISAPHMEALWEGKSFPAPAENLVPQYCFKSHSYSFCVSVSFFLFYFFLSEFMLVTIFYDFHWKPGFDYMVQQSCLLWVAGDRQSVYSMEEDKKCFLFVFICLSQRFDTSWLSPVIYFVCALLWIKIT